jgi:hypothetical protein
MKPQGINETKQKLWLCHSCWQAFATRAAWKYHANGPFADLYEAEEACTVLEAGDAIPAGATVGQRPCYMRGEELEPAEWTDIERNDLVWDDDNSRFVGVVGHRDDAAVDVEPPDGGTKRIEREKFLPNARYRAIRL